MAGNAKAEHFFTRNSLLLTRHSQQSWQSPVVPNQHLQQRGVDSRLPSASHPMGCLRQSTERLPSRLGPSAIMPNQPQALMPAPPGVRHLGCTKAFLRNLFLDRPRVLNSPRRSSKLTSCTAQNSPSLKSSFHASWSAAGVTEAPAALVAGNWWRVRNRLRRDLRLQRMYFHSLLATRY